jgi:phosphoribosylformylglycinamidine synthase I
MSAPRIAVVSFPGTCDDRDAARAIEICGGEPVRIWHHDDDLAGADGVLLPGGFSFGDYLRAGALASLSPAMGAVVRFAEAGGPVLGVCNGFQMLCEARLLPGVLRPNHHGRFNCLDARLVVERATPWLAGQDAGDEIVIPIKHHDGAWYAADDEIERLEADGHVLLRYANDVNGSSAAIAGVQNAAGNVFGLMPHPEHAVDPVLGSTDGRAVIAGLVALAAERSPVGLGR